MEKLKAYIMYSATLIGIFLFVYLIADAFETVSDSAIVANAEPQNVIVVLDAGHGGEDSGAVANGILEKDINLDITLKVRDMLKASGVTVVTTRDTDRSIYDSSASTVREKKVSDLKNRVAISNKNSNNILVSIHQNKFEQSKYSGAQIFYSGNDEKSKTLAESMRLSITGLLQPDNKRELKEAGSNIYLLKNSKNPSVIVECGFLSNEEEAKNLNSEEYRQKMAFAIYCGILEYIAKQ